MQQMRRPDDASQSLQVLRLLQQERDRIRRLIRMQKKAFRLDREAFLRQNFKRTIFYEKTRFFIFCNNL